MTRLVWLMTFGIASCMPAMSAAQVQEEVVYFHTDAVGSVRMITDANGQVIARYDYLPFGESWPADPTLPETRQFTGQERDPGTALDYFSARYYASGNGRFTTPDDPTYIDPFDPKSTNQYAYAYNNPLRFNDPTGHEGDCPGEYDPQSHTCRSIPQGLFDFILESFKLRTQSVLGSVNRFLTAPRDSGCMKAMFASGVAVGTVLGGSVGIVTGPGEAVMVPVGGLGGGVRGLAVGSVACMSSSGGNGGSNGGGGGRRTDHGAGQLSERGFSEADIANTKTGRVLKQADGATVYLKQVGPGRFNVIVEGEQGIITGMKNLTRKELRNLARNYGWNWP